MLYSHYDLPVHILDVLPFLMRISLQLNEEIAPLIVKLITIGLSGVSSTETHKRSHSGSKGTSKTSDAAKAKSTSKQSGTVNYCILCSHYAHIHAHAHILHSLTNLSS